MRILIIAAMVAFGGVSQARANLVTNGDFEITSALNGNTSSEGQLGYNINATGWTISGGYAFLFNAGTAATTGATGQYGNLQLWGPGNGSANGLPAASPTSGNFLGLDGAFQQAPIQQTINNLIVGDHYTVSFYWAGAQQYNFTGPTTEQFDVTLGSQMQATTVVNDVSEGFTGWTQTTFNYTATATSEVLSFLAQGTPGGEPPFSVLDGVDVETNVPEPTSLGLLATSLGVAAFLLKTRARCRAVA